MGGAVGRAARLVRTYRLTLARAYSIALLLPPAAATWIVSAAFLPEWWLGETAFGAAHPAPLHRLHLLSDLKSVRSALLVMANLPLALIGGVVRVFLSGGTLGGIVTLTFLNVIVIPALFLKYGRAEAHAPARDYPDGRELASARD